ncbi:hypothetical protein L873DRAFT_1792227 [Choiromyces venosus 120613-1]|uniref:Acid protease n=1 Tax=Choiromyces venosus 120613-1 TaxID=1336337 RepID=A0A3N4JB64_9PEZI|nr:hypothetical protein L873DRAFT_1792227 [Choiromyces venosus 120613-1]
MAPNCNHTPISVPLTNYTLDSQALFRGFQVLIDGQRFSLRPDLHRGDIHVLNQDSCSRSQDPVGCLGARGGLFNTSGLEETVDLKWNGTDHFEGADPTVKLINTFIDFGDKSVPKLYGVPVVVENKTVNDSAGLALGLNSSFLRTLVNDKLIPESEFRTFQISSQRGCPLRVLVEDISVEIPGRGKTSLFGSEFERYVACINPFQSHFSLTRTMISRLMNFTGHGPVAEDSDSIDYEGDQTPKSLELTVKLENFTSTTPSYELINLKRGTVPANTTGTYSILNQTTYEIGVLSNYDSSANKESEILLGAIFLSTVYLVVDLDEGIFKLAPIKPIASSQEELQPICPVIHHPKSPSPFRNATITVSTLLGVAVLIQAVAIFFLWSRWKRSPEILNNTSVGDSLKAELNDNSIPSSKTRPGKNPSTQPTPQSGLVEIGGTEPKSENIAEKVDPLLKTVEPVPGPSGSTLSPLATSPHDSHGVEAIS